MHCDIVYEDYINNILDKGEWRETRSGKCLSTFGEFLEFDLREGFPLLTTKFVSPRAIIGELLWFMIGETTIEALKYRTFGDRESERKTIWCPDFERWSQTEFYQDTYCTNIAGRVVVPTETELGPIYGYQWAYQLPGIIEQIRSNPTDRRLVVNSWDYLQLDEMALPPCHYSFQFYVSGEYIDLMWHQRS